MSYTVVEAHAPEPGEALVASKGERLRWERKPTQWDGWLYCETAAGVRGWVPERWMKLAAEDGEMLHDYDATELTVSVGDTLEGELLESGWLLARDASGKRGWVPMECVEVSD